MKVNNIKDIDLNHLVLIDPPFGPINGPSISLPVLVSHLKSRDISVSGIDLNLRFYRALVTEPNIRAGLVHLESRFAELNRMDSLRFDRMVEYEAIVNLLLKREKFGAQMADILSCPFDPAHIRGADNMDLVCFLIELVTISHFPEVIAFAPRLRKTDLLSKYSSEDLIKAAYQENFYSQILKQVLHDTLFALKPAPLVGIAVSFHDQIFPALQCARMIKAQWPDTHLTLGGSFISIHLREIKNPRIFEVIDSLVLDEGEEPLERLFREIISGNRNPSIPNVVTCSRGKVRPARHKPHPTDLLSFTGDYSTFDPHQYLLGADDVVVPLCLSRGCKWKQCAFCRTDIPVFRNYCRPSPEALYEQLTTLVKEHGARTVSFSSAFSEPEVLAFIARKIVEDKLSVRWVASSRISGDFTRDLCMLLRDAGCVHLSFGIESFCDRILRLLRKGIQAKLIEKVIEDIDGAIPLFLLMMVGIPTETEQEAMAGFEKLQDLSERKLIAGYNYNLFHLTYGSDIWKNPQKYEVFDIHWLPDNDLYPNVAHFDCPGMTREKACELQWRFSGPPGEKNVTQVSCSGKSLPLRYDLEQISRKIRTAENDYLDTCYGNWLHANKEIRAFSTPPTDDIIGRSIR
jgi:anaerobic magnesium-protoporphyrin IX monomethyl ester cyclase